MNRNRFKIIFNPAVEKNISAFQPEFGSYDLAKLVLDTVADYTLFLHEKGLMNDYSNFAFITQMVDGEWVEIEEESELIEESK